MPLILHVKYCVYMADGMLSTNSHETLSGKSKKIRDRFWIVLRQIHVRTRDVVVVQSIIDSPTQAVRVARGFCWPSVLLSIDRMAGFAFYLLVKISIASSIFNISMYRVRRMSLNNNGKKSSVKSCHVTEIIQVDTRL